MHVPKNLENAPALVLTQLRHWWGQEYTKVNTLPFSTSQIADI